MGYDVHIARAIFSPHSRRYPIRASEVRAVVAGNDDLFLDTGRSGAIGDDLDTESWFDWRPADGAGNSFSCRRGWIMTKNPDRAGIRRMVGIAAELDAWVSGDYGEVYSLDAGGGLVERQPSRAEIDAARASFITRGGNAAGLNRKHPITQVEWLDLAADQRDFRIATEVEAYLPSGRRHIACPPVATWTGHPRRGEVPFFFDEDLIEVDQADTTTLTRMDELASILGAHLRDDNDEAVIIDRRR